MKSEQRIEIGPGDKETRRQGEEKSRIVRDTKTCSSSFLAELPRFDEFSKRPEMTAKSKTSELFRLNLQYKKEVCHGDGHITGKFPGTRACWESRSLAQNAA